MDDYEQGEPKQNVSKRKVVFILFIVGFVALLIIGNNSYVSKQNEGSATAWFSVAGGGAVEAAGCSFCPNQSLNTDDNVSFNSVSSVFFYGIIDFR